jgi:hypothetical protein
MSDVDVLPASRVPERELRVAVVATFVIAMALALTASAPLWLLLASPIVLGVPHVLGDVRYLVMRPALHKRWRLWALVFAPLVWCFFGGGVRAGLVAMCGALLAARGRVAIRAAGIACALVLLVLVMWVGRIADLAFAHAHNFIAVAIWWAWAWRRRVTRMHWLPLAVFAIGCALLLAGFAEPRIAAYPYTAGAALVPLELATLGGRIVLLYAFAQAVHYAVWLCLVPEEDPWLLAGGALASIALAAYAVVDVVLARETYLRLAIFHGHLELAAVALLFVEGRLPLRPGHRGDRPRWSVERPSATRA